MKKALAILSLCLAFMAMPVTTYAATDAATEQSIDNPSPGRDTEILGTERDDVLGEARVSPKTAESPIPVMLGAAALVSAAGCAVCLKKKN